MTTLRQLAARTGDLADDIEAKASEDAIRVALTIISSLAFDTPVDTSNAISGWQIGLGSGTATRRGPFFPGVGGSTFRASAQATIEDAKLMLQSKTPGQSIHITNNEPYIRRLNDGYSSQSPGSFIELAIMRGRQQLQDKRRRS